MTTYKKEGAMKNSETKNAEIYKAIKCFRSEFGSVHREYCSENEPSKKDNLKKLVELYSSILFEPDVEDAVLMCEKLKKSFIDTETDANNLRHLKRYVDNALYIAEGILQDINKMHDNHLTILRRHTKYAWRDKEVNEFLKLTVVYDFDQILEDYKKIRKNKFRDISRVYVDEAMLSVILPLLNSIDPYNKIHLFNLLNFYTKCEKFKEESLVPNAI